MTGLRSAGWVVAWAEADFLPPGVGAWVLVAVLVLVGAGLLVWGYRQPSLGRVLGKVTAVVGMGLGVGMLVWGIIAASRGDSPVVAPPFWGASYSLVIGEGAGFLTSGIVALVLAFIKGKPVSG